MSYSSVLVPIVLKGVRCSNWKLSTCDEFSWIVSEDRLVASFSFLYLRRRCRVFSSMVSSLSKVLVTLILLLPKAVILGESGERGEKMERSGSGEGLVERL